MASERDTLFFDGACGMCRRSTVWLHRLDWCGNLASVDMTSVPESELPVTPETAMSGLPMRTADGRVLVGFPAMRRALSRTPLGAPVAWALCIPGLSDLGRAVYGWVARNRRRDACAVKPPAEDRAGSSI